MRTTTAALLTICLAATQTLAQQPTADPWTPTNDGRPAAFTLLPGPRVAPAAFHVNALTVPLAAGTPLTAHYAWDFGDPGSKYNTLPGWVAAHLYDKPGTYPITLTVTDEAGHVTALKQTVEIRPDDRRSVFVSPDGSDANNGATEATPLKTILAAVARTRGGDVDVRFKAGGTYPADNLPFISGSDTVLDRYGDGPKPILLFSRGQPDARGKSTSASLGTDGRCDGVVIRNLTFATPNVLTDPAAKADKVGITAIYPRGRNITVLDCSFRGLDEAVNAFANPVGLLVQGCDAPGPTDLRGYLVWGQGTDHAYLGNTVGNSTREHNIRMSGLSRVLIYDNDLTNLDRTKTDPGDISKGTIQMQLGSFGYIAHNRVADGPLRTGPRGGSTERPETATDWCVADGNDLTDTFLEVQSGSHHIMFRNNVVHLGDRSADATACHLNGPDPAGRTVTDVTFAHNTVIASGQSAIFLRTFGRQDGLSVVDNLFVAPHLHAGQNGASALYVLADNLSGFRTISHNVWPAPEAYDHDANGMCVIDPVGTKDYGRYVPTDAWLAMPPVTGDRFANVTVDAHGRPTGNIPADGVAIAGTNFDHDGHPRPAGARCAGAFAQAGATRGKLTGG